MKTRAEFVLKNMVSQRGQVLDRQEFYLRMSVQDYFIKWSESRVTQAEVEAALAKQSGPIKTLQVEMEVRKGEWDSSGSDYGRVASRVGPYAVLLALEV